MNNKVIFAAAGHGKTYSLCSHAKEAILNDNRFVLMLSYTNEGIHALENEYRKQNCGCLDNKVVFKTWYSFILSELIKPYQCMLNLCYKRKNQDLQIHIPENFIKSIAFYEKDQPKNRYNHNHFQYYMYKSGDVIPDRASHLAYLCNQHSKGKAIDRLTQIYSHIYIDELQDYAGWDLELICLLFNSKIQITCVGDYKQATYSTNNSPKHKQYRDEKIRNYFIELEKQNICSVKYANTTRRFNKEICSFINTIFRDQEAAVLPASSVEHSYSIENTGIFLIDVKYMDIYCDYYRPVILRYDKRAKTDFEHTCSVYNYGGSKGATYDRVVIIPVKTVLPFIQEGTEIASKKTKSKFYVACTRAKHSVVFAINNPQAGNHFEATELHFSGHDIPAFKYSENSHE